jgi:hypothetical protein
LSPLCRLLFFWMSKLNTREIQERRGALAQDRRIPLDDRRSGDTFYDDGCLAYR